MALVRLLNSDVEIKEGEKILSSEDLGTLVEVNTLKDQLLKEVEELKKELNKKTKLEEEKAVDRGFQKGLDKWSKEAFQLDVEVNKIKKEHEKSVLELALLVSKKIVMHDIKMSKTTLNKMIKSSLETVKQDANILIFCNEKDYKKIVSSKKKFMDVFEKLDTLMIQVKDDVNEGGYIIKTERGIINNGNVDKLWLTLEKNLQGLLNDDK